MKLKHTMALNLLAVAAMVPLTGAVLICNDKDSERLNRIAHDTMPAVIALDTMRSAVSNVLEAVQDALAGEEYDIQEALGKIATASATLGEASEAYFAAAEDDEEKDIHSEMTRHESTFTELAIRVVESGADGRMDKGVLEEFVAADNALDRAMQKAVRDEMAEVNQSRAESLEWSARAGWLAGGVTLLAFLVAATGGLVLMRYVTRGLDALGTLASRYGRGEFDAHETVTGADELRMLGATMEGMASRLAESRAALEVAKEAAESASVAKSAFLANMSHEIRTPMTAILGYTEMLEEPDQSAEQRRDCVLTVRRNGEHLLQIINDILDLSKIESGKMTLEIRDCSVCGLISEVAALMRVRASAKGLGLRVHYVFPFPEAVRTDSLRLKQILVNLVGNAIKFTERGEVQVIVRYGDPAGPRSRMTIEVVDTGIGMSEEHLAGLFRPFSQCDSSHSRRYGGSGLGLAISQRLAGILGGAIGVSSKPGRGSTFTLAINADIPEGVRMINSPEEAVADPEPEAHPSLTQRLNGNVLLVEDGPDNQRLISFLLRKAGANVELADDGEAGIEATLAAARAGRAFDLILMDMQMPRMDGYEATRTLRQSGVSTPIVALTAHAMSGDREKCLAAGCDEYIRKPIQRGTMLAICANFLEQKKLRTAA
ncbi:two-component system, sensor histidine kinase [Phycisphaerales bacterium]|nr:two-component system, sensor histidine kinase [Phycisphaerales bacterium]